jgi:hypothetical protein
LILDSIDSLESLDILILLHGQRTRPWSAAEVSQFLRNDEDSAKRRLARLAASGLLEPAPDLPGSYVYQPRTEQLGKSVDALVETYRLKRTRVIEAIFSKPIEYLHVFADAFRLRKDKDKDNG